MDESKLIIYIYIYICIQLFMKHVLATEAKQEVFSEGSKLFSEGLKGSHYIAKKKYTLKNTLESKSFFSTQAYGKRAVVVRFSDLTELTTVRLQECNQTAF